MCKYTVVTTDELREYGCTVKATDGIVDQLRIIEGIEIAFLLYQTGNPDEYEGEPQNELRSGCEPDRPELRRRRTCEGRRLHDDGEPQEIVEKISGKIREQWEGSSNEHRRKECTTELLTYIKKKDSPPTMSWRKCGGSWVRERSVIRGLSIRRRKAFFRCAPEKAQSSAIC
ncbi:MAG: hypothetical protein ACLUAR_12590 [Pilosibacter sp.]